MISAESSKRVQTEPARILVIEDSESNRYVLSTWLRRAGHDVLEASTGEAGLELIASNPVDLTICDINLPDMTGYMVCEQIKRDPRTRDIPVLHVSSTATQPSDRSEGLRRGAEGYLVEPVEAPKSCSRRLRRYCAAQTPSAEQPVSHNACASSTTPRLR